MSGAWFPHLVRPDNFLEYWHDVGGRERPLLAAHWLAGGADSIELRWLAGLSSEEGASVTTDQMIDVLRSLGVDIEPIASFLDRCVRAVARVQRDLDATGWDRYPMTAANASVGHDNLPAVYAAIVGVGWWSSGNPMLLGMDDAHLLDTAAESVTDTLAEVERVVWPVCPTHDGPPMTPRDGGWYCGRGAHTAARLGELTTARRP